jgi:3-deoxy-D-manno-octulosonate 8-phosphate phosphatase (KDO 8-P phosphatase)
MKNYKEKLKHITTLIFDYDGVMTDGKVVMLNNGEALRTGNVRDGYAIQYAVKKGLRVVILSGGISDAIPKRFDILSVQDIFMGVKDKLKLFNEYLEKNNIEQSEVLYMGDDIPDYPVMKKCGLAVCPANAAEEIKNISAYISSFKGGEGCVRDIIEQVMKVQGLWFNDDAFVW